jgi:nucleotide-binding universal stress UspA family protein
MPGAPILVPLDGTPFAEQALPLARLIASLAGGSLVLAHVVERPMPTAEVELAIPDDLVVAAELRRSAGAYLDDVAARLERDAGDGAGRVPVRVVVLDGEPARAVHDAAVAHGAALVVMASHDRSALGRLFGGSTAEHVAREPGTPVLLLRRHEGDADPDAGAAWREPAPFRRLLVPLDGSPEAEAVLPPALTLARLMGAAVTLVTVHDPREARVATLLPTAVLDADRADAGGPVGLVAGGAEDVDAYLDALARRLGDDGHRVDVRVTRGHGVADAIVRCAADVGADAIAMATHGYGTWGHLAHGNVAEAVLHRVLMPVLLLRPATAPGAEPGR